MGFYVNTKTNLLLFDKVYRKSIINPLKCKWISLLLISNRHFALKNIFLAPLLLQWKFFDLITNIAVEIFLELLRYFNEHVFKMKKSFCLRYRSVFNKNNWLNNKSLLATLVPHLIQTAYPLQGQLSGGVRLKLI